MFIFRDNRERKEGNSVLGDRVCRAALKKRKWSEILRVGVQEWKRTSPYPTEACGLDRRSMCSPDGWCDLRGSSLSQSLVCEWGTLCWPCLTCICCLFPEFAVFSQTVSEACGSICFPNREVFFFYYLEVVVFMNWDKYLVGRSFISWSFQFEFHYFSCLPGEGKNIFSKHSVPFSSFPDRCIMR